MRAHSKESNTEKKQHTQNKAAPLLSLLTQVANANKTVGINQLNDREFERADKVCARLTQSMIGVRLNKQASFMSHECCSLAIKVCDALTKWNGKNTHSLPNEQIITLAEQSLLSALAPTLALNCV